MVKASTPIFVLLWAYLLGIERITSSLIMVVLVIALGEFLTVAGEIHFNVVGFFMCLSASVLSGARWTLVQLKLKTLQPPLKTTIATMRVLSPSMFFSLIFVSLIVERPWITLREGYFETVGLGLHTIGMALIGAFFAIAMILCEFYLIMRANAIILMLGGVIKEMITIIVGYV
jgi:solute carrier family 35 protein C2